MYRIYRMKEQARQQFRWAPHTIGVTVAKPKDYEEFMTAEGSGPYAIWLRMKESDTPLEVGDILEDNGGDLRIYKYVGFEQAQWLLPEARSPVEGTNAVADGPLAS